MKFELEQAAVVISINRKLRLDQGMITSSYLFLEATDSLKASLMLALVMMKSSLKMEE